ncbi:hypothetical protein SpCBS45565_g01303 [Spizellomyces sp. 'palustris']|nr:hypothetical protein SpCBS45565_g01303 [Spizellomyces sp. 'palustris']
MSDKKGGLYDSSAGDTNFRRKWDRAEYEQRAKDRERGILDKDDQRKRKGGKPKDSDEPASSERELLKAREEAIDLTSNLNKTVVVQASNVASRQPGYYCEVCDCVVKDSVNYLDHINGRSHQRNMGMSMRVERSTADQVRARLEALKRKVDQPELDFDARIEQAQKEDEEEKRARKREKKERKKKRKEDAPEVAATDDIDIASMMGFG